MKRMRWKLLRGWRECNKLSTWGGRWVHRSGGCGFISDNFLSFFCLFTYLCILLSFLMKLSYTLLFYFPFTCPGCPGCKTTLHSGSGSAENPKADITLLTLLTSTKNYIQNRINSYGKPCQIIRLRLNGKPKADITLTLLPTRNNSMQSLGRNFFFENCPTTTKADDKRRLAAGYPPQNPPLSTGKPFSRALVLWGRFSLFLRTIQLGPSRFKPYSNGHGCRLGWGTAAPCNSRGGKEGCIDKRRCGQCGKAPADIGADSRFHPPKSHLHTFFHLFSSFYRFQVCSTKRNHSLGFQAAHLTAWHGMAVFSIILVAD